MYLKFVVLPQLALSVEFLFEILYVGAPPTCIVCRISFRNSLCWGPANKRCSAYYFG
ncbi:hypothetical protein B8A10_01640 [Staphylococcus aureus]|nr:hypothetical protein B7437_01780 [Staphylococcus aureus]ORN91163.1 hypothetical protein B8A10_03940 [Staphylococcus aureus]ORN91772.1 hypothetical protein B8A10_01640 [Staphylococcus aureus]